MASRSLPTSGSSTTNSSAPRRPTASAADRVDVGRLWAHGVGADDMVRASALVLLAGLAAMRVSSRLIAPRLLTQPRQDHAAALNRLKADYASYAACSGEIAVYGLGAQVIAALDPHARALGGARAAIVRGEVLIQGAQLVLAALTVMGEIRMSVFSRSITSAMLAFG